MTEIIFHVEESPEGGFEAKSLTSSDVGDIFIEGDNIADLKVNAKEAVRCHFDKNPPSLIRFHYVKEEVFAL